MINPRFRLFAVLVQCLCFVCSGLTAAAQSATESATDQVAAQIRKVMEQYEFYTKTTPHEKVYLHLDKPYYTTGDTVWYKAYALLADGFRPDTLNLTLYVDFVQQDGQILATHRLLLRDGMAHGQFSFPGELTPGYYMIRAYTAWMRNFTDEPLFSRLVPVYGQTSSDGAYHWDTSYRIVGGDQKDTLQMTLFLTDASYAATPGEAYEVDFRARGMRAYQAAGQTDPQGVAVLNLAIPKQLKKSLGTMSLTVGSGRNKEKTSMAVSLVRADSISVRFFPEGGHLVAGVCSRVAFEVTDAAGAGLAASGTVFNAAGQQVQTFASNDAGVGAFYLTPRAGEPYYAIVTSQDSGLGALPVRMQLPAALPQGYVMEVYNVNGHEVQVSIKRGGMQADEVLGMTVRNGGRLAFAKTLAVRQDSMTFFLPCQTFPAGVSQMTLFGTSGKPLSERLVYVNNYSPLRISVTDPKDVYKPLEHIQLDVQVTDAAGKPVQADLSLAVTDLAQVLDTSAYQMNILTHMLLQSDLRGRIDDMTPFVSGSNISRRKALDLLMLTRGWRRYDLSRAFEETPDYPWRFEWSLKIRGIIRHMTFKYPLSDQKLTRLMGTVKKNAFEVSRWKNEVRGWEFKMAGDDKSVAAQTEKSNGFQLKEIDETTTDENGEFLFYSQLEGKYMMVLQTQNAKLAAKKKNDATVVDRRIEIYSPIDSLPVRPFMQQLDMRPEQKQAYLAALRAQEEVSSGVDAEGQQLRILRDSLTTYVIPAVEVVEPAMVARNMAREMASYEVDAELATMMLANLINSTHIPTLYEILEYMYPDKMTVIEEFDEDGNSTGESYTWMGRPILTLDLTPNLPRDFDKNAGMSYRSIESIYVVDSDHPIPDIYERLKAYPEYWADIFDLQMAEVFGAVVIMYTRTETKELASGVRGMVWEGYTEPAEFYSPDYASYNPDDPFDIAAHNFDSRSTLYWNPSVRTDAQGHATVEFFNSDRYTRLHTVVEGMDATGRMGALSR